MRFLQLTQHLSPQHCAFLAKWYPLIALEEEAGKAARPQLWAVTGAQREAKGGACLAGLRLRGFKGVRELAEGTRYCYEFERHKSGIVAAAAAGGKLPLGDDDGEAEGKGGYDARGSANSAAKEAGRSDILNQHLSLLSATSGSFPRAAAQPPVAPPGGSSRGLLSGAFGPGDMALLGVDGRHPALARVTVSEVTEVREGSRA